MFTEISLRESSINENKPIKKAGITDHKNKYFGPGNFQLTKKDINYIIHGACFLASGGGGPIGLALLFMDKMINDSDLMYYVNPDNLEPDKNTAFVAGLGAPDKIFEGFGQTVSLNAFAEMNEYLVQSGQEPLGYLIPVEMGAMNTLIPFIISAKKGIAIINGDPCGRAMPELSMTLFNINNLPINPVILTSDTDESGHYQKTIVQVENADDAEHQARQFARANNSTAGMACYPMRGADLKCSTSSDRNWAKFNQWTVGLAWNLGRHMFKRKHYDEFLTYLNKFSLSSYTLFEGIVTGKEERKIGGFDVGKITVSHQDKIFFIYYKNESLLAWDVTRKCYVAMGPDSINFLNRKNAQPFSNADIDSAPKKNPLKMPLGTEVGVIGLSACKKLEHPVILDLFLSNIREILSAFPEDQIPIPNQYIPLANLAPPSNS